MTSASKRQKKIRELIDYYDNQSEEEGAYEIENAPIAPGESWICVPNELLGQISLLLEKYSRSKNAPAKRSSRGKNQKRTPAKAST